MLDGKMRMSNPDLFAGKPPALRGVPNVNVGTDISFLFYGLWPWNQATRNAGGGLIKGGEK